MRSFVAVVFAGWVLIGSLLPGFGIGQSSRLGDLVQHYNQHRKADQNLGFFDFLNMHYGADSDHQKNPGHSHHNLPVSGHSAPVYSPGAVRLPAPIPVHTLLVSTVNFFRQVDLYSFLAVFALINPPERSLSAPLAILGSYYSYHCPMCWPRFPFIYWFVRIS